MPKYSGDPYQVEYAHILEGDRAVEICREGNWNGWDFTQEMFEEAAVTYNPGFLRAPIQRDHWGTGHGVVLGHILDLELRDDLTDSGRLSLFATIGLLPEGVMLIESGQVNERSISIDSWFPIRGIWYLKHLMLISDSNPAVTNLKPIRINIDDDESDVDLSATLSQTSISPVNPDDAREIAMSLMDESGHLNQELAIALDYKPQNLSWGKADDSITYRVREVSRFDGDFSSHDISNRGIRMEAGKLKASIVKSMKDKDLWPAGARDDAEFPYCFYFATNKNWTVAKAKDWMKKKKYLMTDSDGFKLTAESVLQEIKNENKQVDVDGNVPAQIKITAAIAEGGHIMSEGKDTAVEGAVEAPVTVRVQSGSVGDLVSENQNLAERKKTIDHNAMEAARAENESLKKEIHASNARMWTSRTRTLMVEGYISPAMLNANLTEAMIAASTQTTPVVQKDGSTKPMNLAEYLEAQFKALGQIHMLGQIAEVFEEEESPENDRIALLKSQGVDTSLDEAVRKLRAKHPAKSEFELLSIAMRNKNQVAGGVR